MPIGRPVFLLEIADHRNPLGVILVGAVAEIEAEHIGARVEEAGEHVGGGARGSERHHDFRAPPPPQFGSGSHSDVRRPDTGRDRARGSMAKPWNARHLASGVWRVEMSAPNIDEPTRTELEAAAFRRLVQHLRERTDVQNIDLMNLAGFCRNCLSRWYREAAEAKGIALADPEAREIIYGIP